MGRQPVDSRGRVKPALLRTVLESLTEGLIVADEQGNFILFNPEAERILGLGAKEVAPAEWSSAYGCYLPDRVTPYPSDQLPLAQALEGREALDELIFIRNPAQPEGVWITASGRPLRDHRGRVCGGLVVIRDMSERQSALHNLTVEALRAVGLDASLTVPPPGMELADWLERLRRFRDRYDTISRAVEQTADSVVITNRNGTIEYVNPAFEETTGYTREEALGRTPRILKSGYHDGEFYAAMWQQLLAGRPFQGTIVNRKKSGDYYWAEQTITPLRDGRGEITHYVSVLKDMTERRKIEQQEFFLGLAREVQKRLYDQRVSVPGFDLAAAAFPAHETGGDYFDFLPQPAGVLDLVIGDVSGHGFGAALVMAEARAYLHTYSGLHLPIGTLFNRVNQVLASDLEGRHSVTMVLARLYPHRRTLEYVNAGHVPGFLVKPSGSVGHLLASTGPPLGMFPDHDYSPSTMIDLEQGDTITLLTDGITEAARADDEEFGEGRVVEFLRGHFDEPAADIVRGLYDAARTFSGDGPQTDDIAAVVCRVNGAMGTEPWGGVEASG